MWPIGKTNNLTIRKAKFAADAHPIHKQQSNEETATAYISPMFQQDLDNLIPVLRGSQMQWRPAVIDRIHINTLGQQQPYSLTVPWRQKEVLAQTPIQVQQGLLESKNNSWTVMNVL